MSNVKNVARGAMPVLALIAFWLPVLGALIQPGMMTRSSDGVLHLLRTFQLDTLVRQGALWPRWSPGMAFGYGYPLFNFYPALSLYPALVLHRLGLSLLQSWNLALALSVLTSGLSMYLWARQVMRRRGAFVAAIAYMLSPYQLYDVYGRGNMTESLTLPLLPVVLWAALRVTQDRRWRYALVGALAYAAVLLMHAPASLMLSLVLLTYLLALMWDARERRVAAQAAGLMILGIGLAAFFVVPAYLEKDQVQLSRAVTSSWADFHAHFLTVGELLGLTQPGDLLLVDPAPPRSLGWAASALAVIGVLATWYHVSPSGEDRARINDMRKRHVVWAGLMLIGVVAMTTAISEPVWSRVPLLSAVLPFVQYPSRFLGPGSLLAALLAGAGVAALESRAPRALGATVISLSIGCCACAMILAVGALPWLQVRLRPMRPNPDQAFYVAVERNTGFIGTTSFGEYLPAAVLEFPTTSPMVEPMLAGQPFTRWDAPGAQVLEARDTGLSAELVLQSDAPIQVAYHAFYFPGWRAWLDGQPVDVSVVSPSGTMAVSVPVGRHSVAMRFETTPLRSASAMVSALTAVVLVALWILDRRSTPHALPSTLHASRSTLHSPCSTLHAPRPAEWLGLAMLGVALLAFKLGVVDRLAVPLRWWRVEGGQSQRVFSAPPVSRPVGVRLGDEIVLVGFDAPDRATPGQAVTVSLVWQAVRQINQEYKVFVHLLGADGKPVAQSDAAPAGWTRPTFGWQVGEYVTDSHTLDLAPDLPPGDYWLVAGMYDIAGQRLPRAASGGGDVVELGNIRVK